MDYRHELKFWVSDMDLEVLRYRLKALMKIDEHQTGNSYMIRSLYFDDFNDSCMLENENGLDNRRKFRIRIYDGNTEIIKLEKKIKYRGMTRKIDAEITENKCLTYINGDVSVLSMADTDLEKELYAEIKMNGMRPKTIVEYERTAFVEPKGNVRITFDRNISGSEKISGFLDRKLPLVPLLPKGRHILEVKYDELLPEYISGVLELGILQQTAFSKYYYSRNYKNIIEG